MGRKVKDFIQIDKVGSLDDLITALHRVRDGLPADAGAELMLRGCDVFGRHIAVSYMRPQTEDEAACEARYADAFQRIAQRQDAERAHQAERGRRGHLRAVA